VTREAIYAHIRGLGVSVETADAVSVAMDGVSDKKGQALILWLKGYTEQEIVVVLGCSRRELWEIKKKLVQKAGETVGYICQGKAR